MCSPHSLTLTKMAAASSPPPTVHKSSQKNLAVLVTSFESRLCHNGRGWSHCIAAIGGNPDVLAAQVPPSLTDPACVCVFGSALCVFLHAAFCGPSHSKYLQLSLLIISQQDVIIPEGSRSETDSILRVGGSCDVGPGSQVNVTECSSVHPLAPVSPPADFMTYSLDSWLCY